MARNGARGASRNEQLDLLNSYSTFLGSNFITKLNDPNPENHPLKIGNQTWSRYEVNKLLGIGQIRACRLLSQAADAIGVKDVKDFYNRSTPYSFAGEKGVGDTTIFVAFELFAALGLDPAYWYHRGKEEAVVTFHSLKQRERNAEKRTQEGVSKRSTGNAKPDVAEAPTTSRRRKAS